MDKISFLEKLSPYDIGDEKVRLGPLEDGGYVVNSTILDKSTALFTYGVGHDIRFEEDYIRLYKNPVYLYDHTIGQPNGWYIGEGMHFFAEGLGYKESCKDFTSHYNELNLKDSVVLKIDIEGGEYDYFEEVSLPQISKATTGILLEVHWLSEEVYRKKFESILDKILEYYTITHVHGNSWGVLVDYEGIKFPETIELTLVNNKHITYKQLDNTTYPIENLDYSNRPNYPDVDLSFLTQRK